MSLGKICFSAVAFLGLTIAAATGCSVSTDEVDDIPVVDETIEPLAASLVNCRTVNNKACSAFGQTTTCTIGGSEVALCSCQPDLKWRCASSN